MIHSVRGLLAGSPRHLPVNHAPVIDGFRAHDGIIDEGYHGILSAGEIEPRPFEIVFETPALAPVEGQVAAATAAASGLPGNRQGRGDRRCLFDDWPPDERGVKPPHSMMHSPARVRRGTS